MSAIIKYAGRGARRDRRRNALRRRPVSDTPARAARTHTAPRRTPPPRPQSLHHNSCSRLTRTKSSAERASRFTTASTRARPHESRRLRGHCSPPVQFDSRRIPNCHLISFSHHKVRLRHKDSRFS